MAGTSLGPVYDYLTGDAMKAALLAVNPLVEISEGWRVTGVNDVVVIGRADDNTGALGDSGVQVHQELGGLSIEEQYTVECYIDCWRGGGSQSDARQAAIALFDAFIGFIQADLTLGGALDRWAEVSDFQYVPTSDQDEADDGRRSIVAFTLTCRNKYTPGG